MTMDDLKNAGGPWLVFHRSKKTGDFSTKPYFGMTWEEAQICGEDYESVIVPWSWAFKAPAMHEALGQIGRMAQDPSLTPEQALRQIGVVVRTLGVEL